MRTSPIVTFFAVAWLVVFAGKVAAQHSISVQSADKLLFAVSINGTKFGSAKTGLLRLPKLSAGTYRLFVTFAGDKYPSQNFSCAVKKDDLNFILTREPQIGWVLKDVKSGKEITTESGADDANMPEGRKGPGKPNLFAKMLAEVADDSTLLNPTVWVYSNKIDGAGTDETTADAQQATDTGTYVAATKGVIKASEEEVKGGTEMVFVDFNANGADTIHLMVPSTDVADNNVPDSSMSAQKNNNTDSTQAAVVGSTPPKTLPANTDSSSAAIQQAPVKEVAVAKTDTLAFNTSANRPLANPFFKDTTVAKTAEVSVPAMDTSSLTPNVLANKDTANKIADIATRIADTALPKPPATVVATTADTALPTQPTAAVATTADTALPKPPTTVVATTADSLTQNATSSAPAVLTRTDCKKMLTESAAEKLKHKIYLETDESKMIDIAQKYLDGKCITTDQVKTLASFFLSDDSRLNFFKAVYPSVYDIGNFKSLESYMIDANYKQMFRAILK